MRYLISREHIIKQHDQPKYVKASAIQKCTNSRGNSICLLTCSFELESDFSCALLQLDLVVPENRLLTKLHL